MGGVSDIVEAITYLENAGSSPAKFFHVVGGQSAGHRVDRDPRGQPPAMPSNWPANGRPASPHAVNTRTP
jgi:hypothetical protein